MRVIRAVSRAFILSLAVFVVSAMLFNANNGGLFSAEALSATGFIILFSVVILEMAIARL